MSHFRIQFIVCMVVALALWTVGFALAAIDLERGLVLYYPFEGSGANQITDVSGANNHGEFRGAVRTTEGQSGKALEFPTHVDGALIPESPSLLVTNHGEGFTVSFWVYPIEWNTAGNGENRAVYRHMPYNVDLFRGGGRFHIQKNGTWPGINDAPEMPLETWVLVTATWSLDDGSTLYRDGLEIASNPDMRGEIDESSEWTALGYFAPHEGYVGRMDELRIYSRAIDVDEVFELFETAGVSVSPEDSLATLWGIVQMGL
jgi:hypothetical protein